VSKLGSRFDAFHSLAGLLRGVPGKLGNSRYAPRARNFGDATSFPERAVDAEP
jgi:hypothetical protein